MNAESVVKTVHIDKQQIEINQLEDNMNKLTEERDKLIKDGAVKHKKIQELTGEVDEMKGVMVNMSVNIIIIEYLNNKFLSGYSKCNE